MSTDPFSFILNDGIRRVQAVKYARLPAEGIACKLLIQLRGGYFNSVAQVLSAFVWRSIQRENNKQWMPLFLFARGLQPQACSTTLSTAAWPHACGTSCAHTCE